MVDVAESAEDPWAGASAPADPFVAAAPPGSPLATAPADIVSPARSTDQDPWATPHSASSDPWIETPTSADPFGAPQSPALPDRAASTEVPPASPPADPWSQQPPAPAAEAPGGTPATGARKLRKKLAALTGMHHAGERASKAASKAKEKAKEKLSKKKETAAPPAEPAWSAGDAAAPTDAAPDVAIPAAHDVSPAAARPASLRLRKAAAKMTGMHGAFSPRANDETDEQRAAAQAFDAMDTDGDGELDAEEIFEALSSNNSDVTLGRVKELVAKADKNGNGLVSKQEYLDAIAADIIPEGWRGTLSRISAAAAEASSAAAARLGPAVHGVRKAAARATGQHGAFYVDDVDEEITTAVRRTSTGWRTTP